jgi:hypothetical protein
MDTRFEISETLERAAVEQQHFHPAYDIESLQCGFCLRLLRPWQLC